MLLFFLFMLDRFLILHALQVAYHTPPRFPIDVIQNIREGASILFKRLGLRDFARIDGWFLPSSALALSSSENKYGKTESGIVIFTDINLVRHLSDFPRVQLQMVFFPIISLIFICLSLRLVGWSKLVSSFSKLPRYP